MTLTATAPGRLGALLGECVGGAAQVRTDELMRRALAHDASHVLLVPQAVVAPRDADEVGRLLQATAAAGLPLTFRSGGTSLAGQAGTAGVLADVRRHFGGIEVLDDGARVRVQPGATVRRVNAQLARYGRKLGPDPASEAACTVGGVVANNSSGMACGTVENSYRTVESLVAVLPSGTVVDTGAPDADQLLRTREPALHAGLLALRERLLADPAAVAEVRRQFAMKNTMGYGINALVDFDTAPAILAHLLIGSEGTLAFIASATFRTVPVRPVAASALLVFEDLYAANRALPALVATGATALELMDATSLRVGQQLADAPGAVRALDVHRQAALLVEYQAATADELAGLASAARPTLDALPLLAPVALSSDAAVRAQLWKLRKGLYTSVAGARRSGTTALLEDVVVPVERLADTCDALAVLFEKHGYDDAVIFGHAKDGNIHFMLTDRFETAEQLGRYADFTEAMVDLVLGAGGSLKAEHGTGRVMAPFVRRQYGDELYDVMRQVKALFDPAGLLNPGVLLDDDPQAHLRHIKLAPSVEDEVDRCVECGYCEPVCPSRSITLTPRQRIALRREIRSAELAGDTVTADRLKQDYTYPGVHTCAVDGMCGTACPVGINTGLLVKRLRREDVAAPVKAGWTAAAHGWEVTTTVARTALTVVDAVPAPLAPVVTALNAAARTVLGSDTVPLWSPELPRGGAPRRRPAPTGAPDAVYLPACVNVMFGPAEGPGVQVAFEDLCAAAGLTLLVPSAIEQMCCGTPWSSKGITAGHDAMRDVVLPVIRQATDGGRLPVVCDASSCTEGFRHLVESDPTLDVQVLDVVELVADRVLPALPELGEYRRLDSLTLHPTCSSTQLGLNPDLVTVARAVADQVDVPLDWGCCAFAGDRGMLHPELTASATRREAAEVARLGAEAHASCNRTCELGMTRATGQTYRHVVELLADQVLGTDRT
ncbi:FAD-binding and (Fe-S)-binding domain-containing protein [Cellulomonas sp. NTE-D12]|uniref:FAD-binding and (Fe-S)-binding domain-containing protein n=1 Tax=Cellulomonas sp. NTE-D12 TaxID=2962632 RepID=UPI00308143BB|nr:oxidoreductase [Cellulomonas sp. NTE-D12]